jgi:molecular chaperone HtpG
MEDLVRDSKLFNLIKDENLKNEFLTIYLKYANFLSDKMYLFEEYTNHSISHINFVIETAEKLITEDTLNLLNETDIFTLLLSIVYHDMGMHLSKEGLLTILRENKIICSIDKHSLNNEWNKFIKEISKLDKEDLDKVFENHDFNYNISDIDKACEDEVVLREFVRRNHHRIAHEISLVGFPLMDGRIHFGDQKYLFYHDLAGLIARSHGMDLREIFNFLKDEYYDDWKTPRNIYVIYLMVVLRIADYLHITSDRVNPYRLRMFRFKSERSRIENEKHLCTYESHKKYDSPRTLYITSEPKSFDIFLEMDNLLNSIQNELDTSWAVLGEVYGNSNLEISIRRVDSNIKTKKWLDRQDFVTDKFMFKLDSRVMSLLIEPLYGNNPSFGVRELIQNATDACRDLKANGYENYGDKIEIYYKIEQNDVNTANEGARKHYLIIKDNGIGMNLDIIKNYFLRIGSPYKKSKQWKESKEKDNEVVRNGRFGVGILSSFLLGDEITVKTKRAKLNEEDITVGYEFTTKLFTECIDIKKIGDEKDFIGTEIKINLNKNSIKAIKEKTLIVKEWYKINDVNIIVDINNENSEFAITKEIEDEKKDIIDIENGFKDWKTIDHKDFKEIKWSYDYCIEPIKWKVDYKNNNNEIKLLRPNLICNGIIIPEDYAEKFSDKIIERWPTIYIKDLEGNLDLDLSRYKLNSLLPFRSDLIKDIYQYYIYRIFKFDIYSANKKNISTMFKVDNFKNQKIMFCKNGFTLFNPFFLKKFRPKRIILIYANNLENINLSNLHDGTAYIFERIGNKDSFKDEILKCLYIDEIYVNANINIFVRKDILKMHMNEYNCNQIKFKQSDREYYKNRITSINPEIDAIRIGNNMGSNETFNEILNMVELNQNDVKLLIDYQNVDVENITNYEYYENIFNDCFNKVQVIPYDISQREDIFSSYKDLCNMFSQG